MDSADAIFEQLKKTKPQAIILFGSQATGETHKDSDFDILLIQDTDKPFLDRIRAVHSNLRTHLALDVIVLTPKEARDLPKRNTFFSQILKEGKLIYGRI